MERDKKIVIVVTIIVSIIIVCGISKVLLTKKENKEIIKEVKKDKTFAIMIQNGDTYKEYISTDNKWPDDNYIFSKAECVDNAGNRIEDAVTFNNETRKATIKSKRTIYCTLYFDESNIIKLRENEKLLNKDNLSSDLQGGMYRYQGLYTDDIRNYICLGEYCCKTEECNADNNDYMYRIIGITTDGELKVIKKTSLTNITQWHKVSTEDIEWPDSDLFHQLNDYEEGIYKDNSFYSSLNDDLKKIIIKKDWLYGDVGGINISLLYNSNEIYAVETGQKETISGLNSENYIWNKSVKSYIGLLYIHDALFTYPNGNPETKENLISSWIMINYNDNNPPKANDTAAAQDWLMTRYGYRDVNRYDGRRLDAVYGIADGYMHTIRGVRPVFYLSSKAKISNGNGTKENPYILNL